VIARFPNNAVLRSGYSSLLVVMDRFEEAESSLSYLSEGELISRDYWIDYHILAMSYLKRGEIDEALFRLEKGFRNARWTDVKNYYTTALGLARMRKRQFAKAIEVLSDDVIHLDVFQKQKRLAFMAHSQAELGQVTEASRLLEEIENPANVHIVTLKDALNSRFNLRIPRLKMPNKLDIPSLQKRIDQEEFVLAMPKAA
jgi:tetratricopeptide (TPR) repeat protein